MTARRESFGVCFDFGFGSRFHAFWVPHSSPVLGRVGVLTLCFDFVFDDFILEGCVS
jgi:hypothetical protein